MFLRDLAIHVSREAALPAEHDAREVVTHHIADLFLSFMPQKYVLDGMGKANLVLGPRSGQSEIYRQLINVNQCFIEDFDFEKYFKLPDLGRDNQILDIAETTLADIAARFSSDPAPLHSAAQRVRDCAFVRTGRIRTLSRLTPDRRYRINVSIRLARAGESWIVEVADRKGNILWKSFIVEKAIDLSPRYDYRKSRWEGETFLLLDRFDRPTYQLNWAHLRDELHHRAP